MDPAVDGSKIPNNHLGCFGNPANNGISTTNLQLVWTQDFWTPSTSYVFFSGAAFLVGGFNLSQKIWVKLFHHFPNFRDERKKYLSCHHLDRDIPYKFPRLGPGMFPTNLLFWGVVVTKKHQTSTSRNLQSSRCVPQRGVNPTVLDGCWNPWETLEPPGKMDAGFKGIIKVTWKVFDRYIYTQKCIHIPEPSKRCQLNPKKMVTWQPARDPFGTQTGRSR